MSVRFGRLLAACSQIATNRFYSYLHKLTFSSVNKRMLIYGHRMSISVAYFSGTKINIISISLSNSDRRILLLFNKSVVSFLVLLQATSKFCTKVVGATFATMNGTNSRRGSFADSWVKSIYTHEPPRIRTSAKREVITIARTTIHILIIDFTTNFACKI